MLLEDGKKITLDKKFVAEFTKPVTFQLCNNQGGYNIAAAQLQFPPSRGVLPAYTMRKKIPNAIGKGDGGTMLVEVRYATSQRKVDGEYVYEPQTIPFLRGKIVLNPDNQEHVDLYYFLKNHPKNRDLKLEGIEPIFYEIDPEKNAQESVNKRTARHESETKILTVWDKDELREVAFGFDDIAADKKSKAQLQEYLLTLVDKDPIKFHKQVTESSFVLRANIVKGLNLGLIKEEGGVWTWGEDKDREDKSGTEITHARAGEDVKTRLIIFFNKSIKAENLDYFLERLKEATKPIEKEVAQ